MDNLTSSSLSTTTTTTTENGANSPTDNDGDMDLYSHMLAIGKVHSLGKVGTMGCGIFLCIVAVFSLWGNGLVVMVLYRSKKLRQKPHNVLLLNMGLADILVTIAGYPFTTVSAFKGRYVFGDAICAIQGFLTFLLAMVAMTSLVCLSLYRYVCVCKPWLKYRITQRVSTQCVVVIWVYSVFWTGLPLIGWSRYTLETFGLSCSVDWASQREADILYIYCLIIFCYLLPVAIMCFCYYQIVSRATKLRYVQEKVLDIEEATKHHSLRTEVKLSSMCFIMVFFYTTVWSPYAFVSLWSVYDDVPVWATTLPTMFAKLASTLNPYIYVIGNPDFRKNVSSIMRTFRNDNTVHPRREGAPGRHAAAYTIDRTKDGIFIGEKTVVIKTDEQPMF